MEGSNQPSSHTLCESIPLEYAKMKRYDESDGSKGTGTTFQIYRPTVSKAGVTTADRLTMWRRLKLSRTPLRLGGARPQTFKPALEQAVGNASK